jgi:hypothetical protein
MVFVPAGGSSDEEYEAQHHRKRKNEQKQNAPEETAGHVGRGPPKTHGASVGKRGKEAQKEQDEREFFIHKSDRHSRESGNPGFKQFFKKGLLTGFPLSRE